MVDSIIIKLFFSNILAIDLIASKTKFKLGFLFFLKIGVGTVIINTSDLSGNFLKADLSLFHRNEFYNC